MRIRQDLVELLKEEIGLDPSVHCVTNALKVITDVVEDKDDNTNNDTGPGETITSTIDVNYGKE